MGKASFIRFQTRMRCPHTGRRLGLFQAWDEIQDTTPLSEEIRCYLDGIYDWFNRTLAVPTLRSHG